MAQDFGDDALIYVRAKLIHLKGLSGRLFSGNVRETVLYRFRQQHPGELLFEFEQCGIAMKLRPSLAKVW